VIVSNLEVSAKQSGHIFNFKLSIQILVSQNATLMLREAYLFVVAALRSNRLQRRNRLDVSLMS
jgi:hypothetical protein